MPKVTAHVSIWDGPSPLFLAPGDEVPEWAIGQLGGHVLDSEPAEQEAASEPGEAPTGPAEQEAASEPDFTKPATRGRARKQG